MLGSCLMMGLRGFCLTETEKDFLMSQNIAGVILFKRNIQSFKQVYKLCQELKSLNDPPLLIGVDMEGGAVNRFSHLKSWPSPKELRSLKLSQISSIAYSMSKKLNLLGIDINFAPVVDLLITHSPLLENRIMGESKEEILKTAGAFLKGFKKGGAIPCLKHFPGHGGVCQDSHDILPKDFRNLQDLAPQLAIFQNLFQAYSCWIMTAHIEFPKIEKGPATFSPQLLKEELRNRMGFQGLLLSDDIDMGALKAFSSGEKFCFALKGGCNLVLTCQREETAKEILSYFIKHPEKKEDIQKELETAEKDMLKIRHARKRQFPTFSVIEEELSRL